MLLSYAVYLLSEADELSTVAVRISRYCRIISPPAFHTGVLLSLLGAATQANGERTDSYIVLPL